MCSVDEWILSINVHNFSQDRDVICFYINGHPVIDYTHAICVILLPSPTNVHVDAYDMICPATHIEYTCKCYVRSVTFFKSPREMTLKLWDLNPHLSHSHFTANISGKNHYNNSIDDFVRSIIGIHIHKWPLFVISMNIANGIPELKYLHEQMRMEQGSYTIILYTTLRSMDCNSMHIIPSCIVYILANGYAN